MQMLQYQRRLLALYSGNYQMPWYTELKQAPTRLFNN